MTFNRAQELQRCLENTLSQEVDIVVVIDNASTDNTPELLKAWQRHDKRLYVERQSRCRGGSWGFARGMRWADQLLQGKGWLLLYDDDSWPEPNCIKNFRRNVARYQHQGVTAVGAAVLDLKGQPVESNRPVLNLFCRPRQVLSITFKYCRSWRDLYHVPRQCLERSGEQLAVDAISFVGFFAHLDTLPRGRGRYPRGALFLYSDDTSYSLSLVRQGKRLILDTDLVFRHNTKGGGAAVTWLEPVWKHYYIVRNSFLMNQSLSRTWYLPLCLCTVGLHALKGVLRVCRHGDTRLWRLVWLGAYDGMQNNYGRPHTILETIARRPRRAEVTASQ